MRDQPKVIDLERTILVKELRQRIRELEVELLAEHERLLRASERAEAAEAKLAAVAGLPERWRNMGDADEHAAYWTAAYLCADELEALLKRGET